MNATWRPAGCGKLVSGWASRPVILCLIVALLGTIMPTASASAQDQVQPVPPASIDALDPNSFSVSSLSVATGQAIRITNRGVLEHSFVVLEWGLKVELPTLETVEIIVPNSVQYGEVYTFFCEEAGHRELGQQGTLEIVSPEEARAAVLANEQGTEPQDAPIVVQTNDDFTFTPAVLEVKPGQIIQVKNPGAIEHHFAVDEWSVNETVPPGEVKLVQVPSDLQAGQTFVFYCTVPGHRTSGMEGVISVTQDRLSVPSQTGPDASGPPINPADLAKFVPAPSVLGPGWSQVRAGNARAVLPDDHNFSAQIFPGEGRSATFVGPAGSRATVVVLPFAPAGQPSNQVDDAVLGVQLAMLNDWETNLLSSERFSQIDPPQGCDEASRIEGVTKLYTLPGGSTVCELRSAGAVIFVAVEGDPDGVNSVAAADQIIIRLLQVSE